MDRKEIQKISKQAIDDGDASSWFEEVYNKSNGSADEIPWAKNRPNSALVDYLAEHKDRKGNAIVIGCGLGDDAELISEHGYNTTSFDISETAINLCKERFTKTKVDYQAQDLFNLPKSWNSSFNFIFEAYTVQALPRELREESCKKITELLAIDGTLLVVCHAMDDNEEFDPPPWFFYRSDLKYFEQNGLKMTCFKEVPQIGDSFRQKFVAVFQKI